MSTRDLHEYTPGQFQTVTRLYQEPAADDPKVILDAERVKLAGYDLELWDAVTSGVQLILGTDYTLQFKDEEATTTEGVDIYGGYLVINAEYQAVPLYLTGKIVGGYTFRPYRPQAITLTVGGTIPMSVISDMAVIADTTAGSMTLILPDLSGDPLADNCQITIIPKGPNIVTVTAPTLPASVALTKQAGQFIWGGGWLPVGSADGGGGGMAIGEVVWWPVNSAADMSKLRCDGSLHNIADYPSLFGVLGTVYGGDGVVTFGVPLVTGPPGTSTGPPETNGYWVIQAYDTVQEVPGDPALIKDWVEKFDGTAAPPASVVNAWGTGLYYLGIGYLFNGTPGRATMILYVNVGDGFNRYALASMDFTGTDSWIGGIYDAATNEFKPISAGTDYTNLGVTAIYRWENMAAGELNPPVDGWETIWTGLANTVPNTWGSGTYEFTVTGFLTNDFNVTCNLAITEDAIATGDDVRSSSFTQWDGTEIQTLRVDWDAQTNLFTALAVVGLTPGLAQIMRIRKFNGLVNVLHTYKELSSSIEYPSYGEALPIGSELFLDGTKDFTSSKGRKPVESVVDYEPSKINVDGSEVANPVSKWPGNRGTYGFFGGYTNTIPSATETIGSQTSKTTEGSYIKLTATASGASTTAGAVRYTVPALSTVGYLYVQVKKGNNANTTVATSYGNVDINWTLKTFTFFAGAIDKGCLFISDTVAVIKFTGASVGGTGATFYVKDFYSWTSGDYVYYKDLMWVDTAYPAPYTPGTHESAKLQYNFDWAESDSWTIQGWVKAVAPSGANQTIAKLSDAVSTTPRLQIYRASAGDFVTFINDGTTPTTSSWSNQPTIGTYFHVKVVISPSAVTTYLNGASVSNLTTNLPATSGIGKLLFLGTGNTFNDQFNGYIQDLQITPVIDTSNGHYASGLPYYNPEKTYGKDASWSIDSRGNIAGNSQQPVIE